jgi:hypothetical protein
MVFQISTNQIDDFSGGKKIDHPSRAAFSLMAAGHANFAQSARSLNQIAFLGLSEQFVLQPLKIVIRGDGLELTCEDAGFNEGDGMLHDVLS